MGPWSGWPPAAPRAPATCGAWAGGVAAGEAAELAEAAGPAGADALLDSPPGPAAGEAAAGGWGRLAYLFPDETIFQSVQHQFQVGSVGEEGAVLGDAPHRIPDPGVVQGRPDELDHERVAAVRRPQVC